MSKTREALQKLSDERYFTVVDYSIPNRYPRVYLRTKDKAQARRRLAALDGIEDSHEARRRINALAACQTVEDEKLLVAKMIETPKFIPDREKVKAVLEQTFNRYEIETPVTDEMVSEWLACERSRDYVALLTEWGVPPVHIGTAGTVVMRVYQHINSRLNPRWMRKHPNDKHRALSEFHNIPIEEFKAPTDAPSREKLWHCLETWREHARLDNLSDQHIRNYSRIFKEFMALVGNVSVNQLTKAHFVAYEKHVKAQQGKRSNKWYTDRFVPVAAILKRARRKLDCEFPDGLRDWVEFDRKPHVVAASNKQPMPVDVFRAALDKAEEWAAIDVKKYAESLPVNSQNEKLARANNKKQALRVKRAGLMWAPILRLCCNCGLDPIDVSRLEWDAFKKLNSRFPYLNFSRQKMSHKTGNAIERLIPLLPSTVATLLRWKDAREQESTIADHANHVFINDAKRPLVSSKLAEGFGRLREAIENGDGWSLKHLRNVGPTIGKRAKRPTDERDAFLGHAIGGAGTSRWYEGDVDEKYLTELVNLIGKHYFRGEKIGKPAMRVVS